MKKVWLSLVALVLMAALVACGTKQNTPGQASGGESSPPSETQQEVTLKVGATPVPHAEILNAVKDALAKEGVKLEILEFNDYVQPNVQVYEKQLDANFFQHTAYLEQFNKERSYDLVKVTGVHIEPIGVYSKKVKSLDELKEGAKIAIPNDPTNGGRTLSLLAKHGLIKLKEGVDVDATVGDIEQNNKKLEFVELEAATLPRALDEVDAAAINTNYALTVGLVPNEDALIIEDKDSPYADRLVNILAARPDNKDSDAIQKLAKALNSPEVKKFVEEKYKGAVVPTF
ncbi:MULTISPECIES: MetQ/NlpA family ABC transporter substrate-binding protein [Paenibacillus]|uniref:MetQ/NlpA family ABC transporter substrate-binding protein n=1 Tax=Paenibacillus TaxID=44249 RepID=UPI00087F93E7|nr:MULTISPECIES: MetQ/NlpA family ABC transporter substrate-binding protein [Paenibacillus]NTZ20530.1 ABC transporter substrate-binding protein [Paenibacillus sp. JMULE4]GCL73734.1 MetQ/NlpA family lipoprotein [Paenibacillus naphthalenovorans]SDJ14596.1 D-methionine transport system substrate-binding protein [Paenibacillus naphthalenovorans]